MIYLGYRLKSLRLEHSLTRGQVAIRVGMSISSVSSYELGYRNPSYKVLRKLATLYHVSTDYLLGLTNEKTPYPTL